MIHLGYGLEFNQPCLVAEALAAGCVHDDWPRKIIFPVEAHLKSHPNTPSKPILDVVLDLHNDRVVSTAVGPDDLLNKIDALLSKPAAVQAMVPYLAQYQAKSSTPADLNREAADMIHTAAYILGAAQHPDKVVAIDFVMLHMLTLGLFYPTFLAQDWISAASKARLLRWKAWGDAVMYAGCGAAALYPDRIVGYAPKRAGDGWNELCRRAIVYPDDGHLCKVVRAVMSIGQLPEPREGFPIGKEDFVKVAHIALDSVERIMEPGGYKVPEKIRKRFGEEMKQDEEVIKVMVRWVRWCGVEGAWDYFPDLVSDE